MSSLTIPPEEIRTPLLERSHSPHNDTSRPISRVSSMNDVKDEGGLPTSTSMQDMKEQIDEHVSYYQRHYERIVDKLKAQRELEIEKNREKKILFTANQQRLIFGGGCFIVFVIVIVLVFLFYPRLPSWSIEEMRILTYTPANRTLNIALSASIYNDNFLTMGTEYMNISFYHNTTFLGAHQIGQTPFSSRASSSLDLEGQFGALPKDTFDDIYQELQNTNGVISLTMLADIRTNEIFRLNDLQVTCSLHAWFNQSLVSSIATITSCSCNHDVKARSNHQRNLMNEINGTTNAT